MSWYPGKIIKEVTRRVRFQEEATKEYRNIISIDIYGDFLGKEVSVNMWDTKGNRYEEKDIEIVKFYNKEKPYTIKNFVTTMNIESSTMEVSFVFMMPVTIKKGMEEGFVTLYIY